MDLLVKVHLAAQHSVVLVHLENQSSARADFCERMFDYFTRLRAKFALPIYPIALFSFETPRRKEPDTFTQTTFEREVVRFAFQSIQLNRLHWRDYVDSDNPVATALMVKMQVAPAERVKVRLASLRLFATLRLEPRTQQTIGRIDLTPLGPVSSASRRRGSRDCDLLLC